MTIAAIDFGRLYQDHLIAAARTPKPASDWDARAADMKRKVMRGPYVDAFIAGMNLDGARTLLDIGCGPGTIGLALADRLERVYGLDYSRAMLDMLVANAAELGLDNVEAIHRAWEDDWSDLPQCDIAVASRSTLVADMAAALKKLDASARLRVYLTHIVGGSFIDPAVLQVLGRTQPCLPDYIYIVNILHRMGIHPRIDYIETPSRLADAVDFDSFADRVAWSLGELDDNERARLQDWYQREGTAAIEPIRWALISWDVRRPRQGA